MRASTASWWRCARLAEQAAEHGVIIGLENEHACNIGTGRGDGARAGGARSSESESGLGPGERGRRRARRPFPEGYGKLPVARIAHVHAKDCTMDGHKPLWCAIGEGVVGWRGQMDALVRGRLQGLDQPGDALAGSRRRQARGQHDLRPQAGCVGIGVGPERRQARGPPYWKTLVVH